MIQPDRYESPAAVESAILAGTRRAHALDDSLTIQERIRLEYPNRFLSRIFFYREDSGWVLKGGTTLLARAGSARATSGIDLFRENQSAEAALEDLIRLAKINIGDFFRFEYISDNGLSDDKQQTYNQGKCVKFDTYIGAKKKDSFHVDMVTNVAMTDEAEIYPPANALDLPKLESHPYRLYPVVDHIADKVCATLASYNNGRPSSRQKTLSIW